MAVSSQLSAISAVHAGLKVQFHVQGFPVPRSPFPVLSSRFSVPCFSAMSLSAKRKGARGNSESVYLSGGQ